MHGHSWALLVPLSPRDDAITLLSLLLAELKTPAPAGLVAASAMEPGPERSPEAVNQGTAPEFPGCGSRASRLGTHQRAHGGAKVRPCKALGWGFAESPDAFTAAPCVALIAFNEHPH